MYIYWYFDVFVVGAPTQVTVAAPPSVLSLGDSLMLTCSITLLSGLASDTALEVSWTLPDSSTIVAADTGSSAVAVGVALGGSAAVTKPSTSHKAALVKLDCLHS